MPRSIARASLCLVLVAIAPAPVAAQGRSRDGGKGGGFSGQWSTMLGPLVLKQSGKKVYGTYGYEKKKLTGTATKGTLQFKLDGGTGEAVLWEDKATFTGSYTWGGREHRWGGYRIAPGRAKAVPGEITSGQTKSWLNYHLRVPRGYSQSRKYPAIAFFHGSNMTSSAYLNTLARRWPKIAKRYILVGFDGEHLSPYAKDGRRAHNYTYVNFSGHEMGPEEMHRQSPALVAEALDELSGQLPISYWFAGGHSQGGYLTYAVHMFYPEKVRGVFPMSCGMIVQCEPDYQYFEDRGAKFRRKQREVAVAIIHGENDRVVQFSAGQYGIRALIDGGFPAARLFTSQTAAHMFAHLPVDEAVAWLEQMTSEDPQKLLRFAKEGVAGERYRDASAALLRAERLAPGKVKSKAKPLWARIDKAARDEADRLAKAIKANKSGAWVDGFLEFRQEFAFAPAAKKAMAGYARLRKQHQKKADAVFVRARAARSDDVRRQRWQEIVDKYYASKWYEHVKGWLAR